MSIGAILQDIAAQRGTTVIVATHDVTLAGMCTRTETILDGAREALAYALGGRKGFVAHVPECVDVRAVRERLGLSQAKFASRFGFALDAVRNWEQGRRQPDVAARAFADSGQ